MNRTPRTTLTLWLALGLACAPALATSSNCISGQVSQSVVLPDGSEQAAGKVRVCMEREFTPTTDLHAVAIDGATLGVFPGRSETAEGGPDATPFLIFQRDGERLVLEGYGEPREGKLQLHWFTTDRTRSSRDLVAAGTTLITVYAD